jgi:hypothetical protein
MVLEGREKSAARSRVAGILPTRALTLVHPTAYKRLSEKSLEGSRAFGLWWLSERANGACGPVLTTLGRPEQRPYPDLSDSLKEAFSEGGFKEHTLGEVAGRVTRFASKVRVYGQQRRSTIALLRHRAAFALRRSGVRFPSTPLGYVPICRPVLPYRKTSVPPHDARHPPSLHHNSYVRTVGTQGRR